MSVAKHPILCGAADGEKLIQAFRRKILDGHGSHVCRGKEVGSQLEWCRLTGQLPQDFPLLCFAELDLSDNRLSGHLPGSPPTCDEFSAPALDQFVLLNRIELGGLHAP